MAEVALSTTQSYGDEHNMVVGSLNHFTITVKDVAYATDKRFQHRARSGDAVLGTDSLIAGVEYTVKTVATNQEDDDWTIIGHKNGSIVYNINGIDTKDVIKVGDKFVAQGFNADGSEIAYGDAIPTTRQGALTSTLSFGSVESLLKLVVPALQNVMSIVAIGKVTTTGSNAGEINIAVENSGKAEFPQPLDATGTGTYPDMYPGVTKERILAILNNAYGPDITATDTTRFEVNYFDF